jgi:hypothetical protein
MHIKCPSGLAGEIRKLKASEANILANRKQQRSGKAIASVLAACWTGTDDPGPYDHGGDGSPDFTRILTGDQYFLMLMIRAATYGPEYKFKIQCRDETCRQTLWADLNIPDDLEIQELSPESLERLRSGEPFETALEDGTQVTFRLPTVDAVRKVHKQWGRSPDKRVTIGLAARIVEIEGVQNNDLRTFIEDMDLGEMSELIRKMDDADSGVESEVEVECTHCGALQEVELPLGREFWLPQMSRRSRI